MIRINQLWQHLVHVTTSEPCKQLGATVNQGQRPPVNQQLRVTFLDKRAIRVCCLEGGKSCIQHIRKQVKPSRDGGKMQIQFERQITAIDELHQVHSASMSLSYLLRVVLGVMMHLLLLLGTRLIFLTNTKT